MPIPALNKTAALAGEGDDDDPPPGVVEVEEEPVGRFGDDDDDDDDAEAEDEPDGEPDEEEEEVLVAFPPPLVGVVAFAGSMIFSSYKPHTAFSSRGHLGSVQMDCNSSPCSLITVVGGLHR